jgi:hypothetical protein
LVTQDTYHRIRKISGHGVIITTIAGTGERGPTTDGGLAKLARISNPAGVAVDKAGNVYFSAPPISRSPEVVGSRLFEGESRAGDLNCRDWRLTATDRDTH